MSVAGTGHHLAWEEWRLLPIGGKLAFARAGLRLVLDDRRRRGIRGRMLAAALAPLGLVYIVACVVRDSVYYRVGRTVGRRLTDRRSYLRHRYGGTQRFVDWRERRLVRSMLGRIGRRERVLDVPSGYGRFVPLLDGIANGHLVCADIDEPRLRALGRVVTHNALSIVRADLQGTLPFRTAAFDLVFNLRYLHHAKTIDARARALAELARVSRRWVVVSYYRRSNLHALIRNLQRVTRGNRRSSTPTMIDAAEFDRLVRDAGYEAVREEPLLPWFHAQRLVLLEKTAGAGLRKAERIGPVRAVAA